MLVFVTAVKHPDNSESYEDVWRLLNNTLYSVCSQNHADFRVVVVCDRKLPLFHNEELINRHTDFIEVDFPSHGDAIVKRFNDLGNLSPLIDSPERWRQWSRGRKKLNEKKGGKVWGWIRKIGVWGAGNEDQYTYMSAPEVKLMANYALNRGSKQLIGILAAKKYRPDYVLIFDADDYVGDDIAAYVNARLGENGWIMTHGYKLVGNLITPFYAKNSFCGTGNIINYSLLLEDIPANVNEKSTQDELFRYVDSEFLVILARHGKVRGYYKKKERAFLDFPTRSAVHLLGHHESNDDRRRRLRKESSSLRFDEAQKHAAFSPITKNLLDYFNILPMEELKMSSLKQVVSLDGQKHSSTGLLRQFLLLKTREDGQMVDKLINFSSELTQGSLCYQKFGAYVAKTAFYPSDIQYNLTISETSKFVWFRVGKVGSRTILDIFGQANIELTAEHPFDIYYPINSYKEYFRFAFVRNPWDRLVSCWRDKVITRNKFNLSDGEQELESFIDYVAMNVDLEYGNPHLRLQSSLIDLNHLDFLGRFERFEKDLKEVMNILDIDASIKKKNASNRKGNYREYYTDRAKDKVAKLYTKDIKIFNYEF